MQKVYFIVHLILAVCLLQATPETTIYKDNFMQNKRVIQSQLDNGLTIVTCPKKDAAIVSIQYV